ncbi:MAG: hypothetical protein WAO91_03995 [Candidatus Nitrosotenuis sp.]
MVELIEADDPLLFDLEHFDELARGFLSVDDGAELLEDVLDHRVEGHVSPAVYVDRVLVEMLLEDPPCD